MVKKIFRDKYKVRFLENMYFTSHIDLIIGYFKRWFSTLNPIELMMIICPNYLRVGIKYTINGRYRV